MTPAEKELFASSHHQRPRALPPAPAGLAGKVFDVLALGAILDAGSIVLCLGTSTGSHFLFLRHVEQVLCDHPEAFDHNGRGWMKRRDAQRPGDAPAAAAAPATDSSTWKSRYAIELAVREQLDHKVANQRRHMNRQHELLEQLCGELAAATSQPIEQVLARLVREEQAVIDQLAVRERAAAPAPVDRVRPRLSPGIRAPDYREIIRALGAPTVEEVAKRAERSYAAAYAWISTHVAELERSAGKSYRYSLRAAA